VDVSKIDKLLLKCSVANIQFKDINAKYWNELLSYLMFTIVV